MESKHNDRTARVVLTPDERDLLHCMHHVETELRIKAQVDNALGKSEPSLNRIMDLLNLKSMLLASILRRVETPNLAGNPASIPARK